ncbi:MAG TPA: hypothetical protein VGB04_11740 [Allosphingosinicella sp.]|jgi:hypothetical protein
MDAPKGRYRVEEKDGRLIVIDTVSGSPVSPQMPRPGEGPGVPAHPAGPLTRPPGLIDRLGRALLHLTVSRWDEQGRAVVAWEWEENGRKRRWDAALDPGQQRRLGRALLAAATFPLVILLSILGGFEMLWLLTIAGPAILWGVLAVVRLQRETGARGG